MINSSSLPTTSQRALADYHGLTILISVLLSVITLIVIFTIGYFAVNYMKKKRPLRSKTGVRTKGILKTPSCSPEAKALDFEIQGAKGDGPPQSGDLLSTLKEEIELSGFSSAPPPSVGSSRELLS